jgi:hypothetical protein
MEDPDKSTPLHSPVGGEADVERTAETITSKQITAITIAGEPFTSREQRLKEIIAELEARVDASERGRDLDPLLEEARAALDIVRSQREEDG